MEQSHSNIQVRQDTRKLGEILSDDFFEIGSSGNTCNKEDCLESGVILTEMSLHNYQINLLADDVILATYYLVDKTRNRNTLRSSIWKHINGRWQLYFHQGTKTELQLVEFRNNRKNL
ncbi:DUF4440 domain-containing protein [Gracilibacillus kekensis]|uniref:DUF4440 domain-containing protein n=1 Tax=Gracilibacillus kekensis TaxID=1027249 RepID=A0A1M7ITS5_9BACI|nr:DUF4440 domain-containing protein [Gracilibacillus kekensis]SHM44023.1 hypothetical protein SAMN05216179_0147 [Gracilibacillus kekensis]